MFKIKIAGLVIQIDNKYEYIMRLCRDYITEEEHVDLFISATEEELLEQQSENDDEASLAYCESLCVYRNICLRLPEFDAFLIHGAAIEMDGQAYIFLAKSGTGKSTHIRSWWKHFGDSVHVVNGDKPILRRLDGKWYVCGTPWRGKEFWGENTMAPIKALCFIERDEQNRIEAIDTDQVIGRIFHQLLMPKTAEEMDRFFSLLDSLLTETACYLLYCNKEEEAAMVAYEGMR